MLGAYADFLEKEVGTDQAIEEAKRLAGQFKGNALYSFLLARLYIKANRLDDAQSLLKQLVEELERSSDKLDAQVELARITQLRGDKQGALDQLATILKTDSKNEAALLLRATIRLADAKFDEAVADARTVLSDTPTSPPALAILAKAYAATNENELAIGALQESCARRFRTMPRCGCSWPACWSRARRTRPSRSWMRPSRCARTIRS